MDEIDIDALVEELQGSVAARRASGDYPPGLEQQLEAEFKLIMGQVHRDEVGTAELRERIRRVGRSVEGVRSEPELGSRMPGGAVVHGATAKFVRRHTGVLADSVRALGKELEHTMDEVLRLFEVQREADERQLNDVVSALFDRVATVDHLADAVLDLERRMARLESARDAHG